MDIKSKSIYIPSFFKFQVPSSKFQVSSFKFHLIIILLFLILPVVSWAKHKKTVPGSAADGIINSRHNLSRLAGVVPRQPSEDGSEQGYIEVCVYCHTPHDVPESVDSMYLWARTTKPASYKTYGSKLDEDYVDGVSGSSLACLACHDGVTTMDRLINTPKRILIGYEWSTVLIDAGSRDLLDYLTDLDLYKDILAYITDDEVLYRYVDYQTLNLGIDMTNDHPIGIEYNPDVASLRDPSTVISSVDIGIKWSDGRVLKPIVEGNFWSVRGAITDSATIHDILKSGNFGTGTGYYIQCATCHDPHFKNQTNPEKNFVLSYLGEKFNKAKDQHMDDSIDGLFLRRVGGNSDSGVCRTCHGK